MYYCKWIYLLKLTYLCAFCTTANECFKSNYLHIYVHFDLTGGPHHNILKNYLPSHNTYLRPNFYMEHYP